MSGQLLGASRTSASFANDIEADPRLQQQLIMYKQPASIRDMKQVYFYVDAMSDLVYWHPLCYNYGVPVKMKGFNEGNDPDSNLNNYPFILNNNPYFGRIGTIRKFNIVDKVNSLLDVRVPKDKYMFEINMVEATIEADATNYVSLPDLVMRRGVPYDFSSLDGIPFIQSAYGNPDDQPPTGFDNINIEPTYSYKLAYGSTPITKTDGGSDTVYPERYALDGQLRQATKVSAPQTLYVRIKELDNGEPYNWAVTNSGSYSIDKGHQLLVRHGDITCSDMHLEFGHMVYTGADRSYTLKDSDGKDRVINRQTSDANYPKHRYQEYKYVDYNLEVFDVKEHNWGRYNYRSELLSSNPNLPMNANVDVRKVTMVDDPRQYPDFYFGQDAVEYFDSQKIEEGNPVTGAGPLPYPYDGADNYPQDRQFIGSPNPIEDLFDKKSRKSLVQPYNRPPFISQFMPLLSSEGVWTEPSPEAGEDVWKGFNIQGKPLFYSQQVSRIGFRFLVRLIHLF